MTLLVNDKSFHGQFEDYTLFRDAIDRLMEIRKIANRYRRTLYCHRGLANAQVTRAFTMPQMVKTLNSNEQRALAGWFNKQGPFWDDVRNHQPEDYLECKDEIVTDTAVGEAGWCCLNGIERGLVSIDPSDWLFSPVSVDSVSDNSCRTAEVLNHWIPANLEAALQAAPTPIDSWEQLADLAMARFTKLTFAVNTFEPLNGYPLSSSATERILVLLKTLNHLKSCFKEDGTRTPEGQEIHQNFFTGKKGGGGRGALFSGSSDSEKVKFKDKLTFKHPADNSKTLFCPWHGKIQTPQLRIHFSWPVRADTPLFIVYVGPKITKQ